MKLLADKNTINIAGIQLPCINTTSEHDQDSSSFVYENGTSPYNNIQQLALAVSCNRPVLLQGPVGSGKTCTVEYLAYVTGHKQCAEGNESVIGFVKVQLGEQTDSRMLLGGYQSTEIPGKFIWKPGVLTNAIINGYWILLEDIDSTSSDVVTVIDNLIRNQSLSVPGFGDNIIPHPEFRLFATQRTLHYDSNFSVKCDILKHWFVIQLKPLNSLELVGIISNKFPSLSCVAKKMVSVLDLEHPIQGSGRIPSARDVLKWCNRCSKYFETGSFDISLRVFQDAVDIFCGYMDKNFESISEQIGFQLGIVKNKAFFLNDRYKPNVCITEKKLVAGRSSLERHQLETVGLNRSRNMVFSLTAPSCRLIEKIACCLDNNEPVLLVGETGSGKTTVLQYMANILGRNLIVINMNQQSDTADLVGGFKPVTFRWIMRPLCDTFESLFRKLFDAEKNSDCLNKFLILFNKENWDVLLKFISYVQTRAVNLINYKIAKYEQGDTKYAKWVARLTDWEELGDMVKKYTKQCELAEKSLVFSFIQGSLVKAVKRGDWVLLDEINLATSETLDCLSGLLEDSRGSLLLLEKGESKPILRDSGFRLFAAMNPATDVGKKRLPVGLRNRFTEFYIEELNDSLDLYPLVESYLMELNYPPEKIKKIVNFYLKIKKYSKTNILDGNGKIPHYSLRNLCRALMVASKNLCGNAPRSLYEGLNLSFLTQLDKGSYNLVHELVARTATEMDIKALLNQPIPKPSGKICVKIEGFWIPVGSLQPLVPDNYILTDTVKRHLKDVIRITSLGSGIPILLEGDTSVGKTSLINYLAKCTGNFCARVNNHEHTDIQEYVGTYTADSNGKLIFKEGILCEAMRKGYWLILDELNLAPSEVLEALNRVLDDNRELYIPETQTVIKAHEKFMLFATQNPPGLYGGRKELSRAFKNRFIELQFCQIPADELITILEKRCQLPLSYCKKMVAVMSDLQLRRRGSEIFIGKSGFITLRDLFRWGERYQRAVVKEKFHDWEQHLADEGYILLAGRVRLQEESKIIEEVISKHFKRKTSPHNLFSLHENTSPVSRNILENILSFSKTKTEFKHVVWTFSMRRLAVLVCKAIEFSEPVLLVGETGCGKTTVVQILALMREQNLYSVNCHTHSDSADFLGSLRPIREESRTKGKLFEWCDGPLIQAMRTGSFFLADEISLADDSVLERLNSLLEPERTILLTEKGGGLIGNDSVEHITVADEKFQFIGTMNPGGDYGKKELSPALRNRFTEIWVEVNDYKFRDYQEIIRFNLKNPEEPLKSKVSEIMMNYVEWFQTTDFGKRLVISVRDIMTWIEFMNRSNLEWFESCLHGCCLTFLDALGCGTALANNVELLNKFRMQCLQFLVKDINEIVCLKQDISSKICGTSDFVKTDDAVGIHPFYIPRGKNTVGDDNFFFNSPTTSANTLRLLRGMQMNKAILLEGSPGVGKTSLVSSLARASGNTLTRINLSDQTDISDLFGADLPEEGATAGHFVWRDGPFLSALKNGHWILLDELNLALQSVLEGLNAVLDHRGSAFIPELNRTFYISKETKLFACQNPLKEGGSRRGLPKSLLNRFTQVYIEQLSVSDYIVILKNSFPEIATVKIGEYYIIDKMVEFNSEVCKIIKDGKIGCSGGPWEFNLRDITRWVEGTVTNGNLGDSSLEAIKKTVFDYANLLYFSRFRSRKDVDTLLDLFESVFGYVCPRDTSDIFVTEKFVLFGNERLLRDTNYFPGDLNEFEMFCNSENSFGACDIPEYQEILRVCRSYRGKRSLENLRLLQKQYPVLRLLSQCVQKQWLAILVGDHGSGKTCCVRVLAALANRKLRILSINSAMDTTEILGGFEQTDYNRHLDNIAESGKRVVLTAALRLFRNHAFGQTLFLLKKWLEFSELPVVDASSADTAMAFIKRLDFLNEIMNCEALRFDPELKETGKGLSRKLRNLKERQEKEESVTSGGKFEWVDSILIKCMEEGSWLLMEDVNLCSSAVLDRLNCLLEPNGCLTVGERGALEDGSLFTIKPHQDFRLFFTMNPKNGLISRAMRNRGVEIYLMPDSEISDWTVQDRLAMLSDVGISEMATQRALIKFEKSRDVRNISNLIGNGFWLAQYVKHGFDKSEAFCKSTQEMYKISSHQDLNDVRELSSTLNTLHSYCISYARPPLNSYFVDDGFARLKQSSAFLRFLTEVLLNYKKGIDKVPLEDLEHFVGYSGANLKVSDGIKYSIFYVYMLVTGPSMIITPKLISDILKNIQWQGVWHRLSDTLGKVIEEPILGELIQIPWDYRWYNDPNAVLPLKNKTFLLLKFSFLLFHESRPCLQNLTSLKNKKTINVAEYSKAVQENYLEDVLPGYPVMAAYNALLDEFDDVVQTCLKCRDTILNDTQVFWLLNAFKRRFLLGKMAGAPILIGAKRTPNEETLTQVDLYFLWFSKFVLEGGHTVFMNNTGRNKYEKLVEKLKLANRSDVSVTLLKISNSFRRSLGHPAPDKYLPKEVSAMEVEENNDFHGDVVILKTVLNNFVQHFHSCFITRSYPTELSSILSANCTEIVTPLKPLVEQYKKGDEGLSSEVMYHCLAILNSEYEFFDALDDKEEESYLKQVLPFHRAVWTCRIVHFLFRSPEKWSMINYKNSARELRDISATIFPQICSASEMNARRNEWIKLSAELTRVRENLKTSLGCDIEDLTSFLIMKSQQNLTLTEKMFFERVLAVVKAMSTISVSPDSEYYVYGSFWILLGLVEIVVLQGARVDPIRKKLLKAKCAKYEEEEIEPEIQTFEINGRITETHLDHPFLLNLRERLEISKKKILKYTNLENVKRDAEKFRALCQEANSFLDVTYQVLNFCEGVLSSDDQFSHREHKILCGKARFIRNKNRHFMKNVRKDFLNFFGDLAYPFLAAAAQIEHGMNLITSELLRRPFPKDIQDLVNSFCTYPIPVEELRHPFHVVKALSWCTRARDTLERDKLLLLFSSCRIKCNEYLTFKTKEKYEELMELFTIFVGFWRREEEKRLEKNMEEESLYLKRGVKKCVTTTEEEELEEEQSKLFPTYEKEFEEVVEKVSEDWNGVVTPEQLSEVTQMHMKLVKEGVRFNWISHRPNQLSQDFLTPLKLRYLLLSHILPHVSFLLEYETDRQLLPGLLLLIHAKEYDSLSSDISLLRHDKKIYDFYKDKNVSEASNCLNLLMGLKVRCLELLEQWPEHPALVQINVVIGRILGFPIESPLMKFLTGLEILLQSCQQWESVAHSGVSISDYLISLTNLIIDWRKLELQGWRNCFETAFIRMETGASKWWYHIWTLIEEYLSEEEKISLTEVLQTLYNFIETSPIGEFGIRLEILLSFHCHLTRLGSSKKSDSLSIAFWNLYAFYNQYTSEVSKKLETLSAPVVKKLKDYVSIAKWNDITYWSVKQAIHKSHRSLLKYIKEYEGILKQRVDLKTIDPNPCLENKKNVIHQDINRFLKKVVFNEKFRNVKLSLKCPEKKFEKASKFCTEIVLTAEYPNLILGLEYLSQQICESIDHFRDLDVDRTLSKEQQKSHARSIVHQKRRALSDLLKNLKTIGLSYQKGTSIKEFGVLDLSQTAPMTLSQKVEKDRLSGEEYYLKTVSRRLVLDNCLLTPSKEIGPAIIERLRGYSSHFMDINMKQKVILCKFEVDFQDLTRYESVLSELTQNQSVVIPDQELFSKSFLNLQETIDFISYEVDQFHLILNSWPEEGDKLKKMNFLGKTTPEIMTSSIFEESYISVRGKFDKIRERMEKLKKSMESISSRENIYYVKFEGDSFSLGKDNFSFYYLNDIEKYNKCVEELREVVKDIEDFRLKFVTENVNNCLTECLEKVGRYTFDSFEISPPKTISSPDLENDIDNLIQNVLLTIQKVLKKFKDEKDVEPATQGNEGGKVEGDEEECNADLLEDHLTKKLVGSLQSDIEDLNIEYTNQLIISILKKLSKFAAEGGFVSLQNDIFLAFSSALPFIQQYSILCSYFLEQQRICYRSCNKLSSILIGTFIEIARKGFCIPPEYEEDGEGNSNQGGGGLGLGEGEGTRDVSDRIESEDQLEGAEPQGKEKQKEEDKECKEEEKGIEMSEDLDGKAQNIEKKAEDEEENSEEEEDEPDVKEMGDTEEGAEKLEKELWSSDEENEEDKENESKEETGLGQGKQTTENKYAGNENEAEEQDEGEEERKEKRKDEIDEINEQEENGDQIDPYHGHHQPEPEPEPFELPEEMNLDDGETGDNEEEEGKNPFDIDAMKEVKSQNELEEEKEEEKADDKEREKDEEMEEDASEGEEKNPGNLEEAMEEDENGDELMTGESDKKERPPEEEENGGAEQEEKEVKEFEPSDDKPTTQPAQPAPESEKDELASKDEVVGSSNQTQFETQAQEVTEKPKEESNGTGQAEIENMNEGHEVGTSNKEKVQPGQYRNDKEKKQRERPGRADEDRTLADSDVNIRKKLKTLDRLEKDKDAGNNEEEMEESELYEHVSEKIENATSVIDAATKEQAEGQPVPNKEEEQAEEAKEDDISMDVDEENAENEEIEELEGQSQKVKDMKKKEGQQGVRDEEERTDPELQGEFVETATVQRGPDTTYHTNPLPIEDERVEPMQAEEMLSLKRHIQEQIQSMNQSEILPQEKAQAWNILNSRVEELSRDLSEQLRLILEPSKATRLKGDFRTGRRINMRKIISYIASEFRKDNIWLRRTKPWKREHEIVLAIDDSSSMDHNNSKELAFESLALVSKALSLLEAGDLGVVSFGEQTRIIHPLGEPFTEDSGAKLLREFTFCQNKTLITEMLDLSCSMMGAGKKKGEVSQLLIIISDGRGVFSEGLDKVKLAVRRATDQGIFLVFVIIDEPMSKDSIMDIRMPEFKDGKFLGIKCYLEEFPFPYYMILRNIGALPSTLGDALRQWFQLVTSKNLA